MVGVGCGSTTLSAICSDVRVRIVESNDIEFLVLKNSEIERRKRCVIVPCPDHRDALGPARDRLLGNLPGHGRGCKAANGKLARASEKLAAIVGSEDVYDAANYISG